MVQTAPALKQNRDWVGAGAGFLFVVLTVVGLGVGGSHPDPNGPIETIRSRFLTDPGPSAIQAGSYIQAVAVLPFVVFAASIARWFWRGGKQLVAAVAFGAALVLEGLVLVENALLSVLAFSVAKDGDAGAIRALFALRNPILLDYLYFPFALFAFALAVGTLTAGVFPRWYGWLTAVVGLVFLSAPSELFTNGFWEWQGGLPGFLVIIMEALWALLTSGLLLRRMRAA